MDKESVELEIREIVGELVNKVDEMEKSEAENKVQVGGASLKVLTKAVTEGKRRFKGGVTRVKLECGNS
ncbi:hypothetical protein GCK72_011044 [Caenorhabditis remanei]|uniref:Uncharacterized protein n=1 Tax=Caenorhabditis remanei TaxID=31234 RepID=A0A6A5H7B7_CAERE|nr:hypothetical protein GCK72_011044 [Caenorhabditis remanei]KAF1762781.1 hypothetical protein GCK72_011044 [Caenorhabditis remanei]